jgi:hypothetical protein
LSVLGELAGRQLETGNQLMSKFNKGSENAVFTVVDEKKKETSSSDDWERLKSMITAEVKTIERKGVDAYTVRNCENFVLLSNDDKPMPVDRRNFQIEVGSTFVADEAYFEPLVKLYQDHETKNYLYTWLMRRDITGWNPRCFPGYETESGGVGNDKGDRFVTDILKGEFKLESNYKDETKVFDPIRKGLFWITSAGLFKSFGDWCNSHEEIPPTEQSKWGKEKDGLPLVRRAFDKQTRGRITLGPSEKREQIRSFSLNVHDSDRSRDLTKPDPPPST